MCCSRWSTRSCTFEPRGARAGSAIRPVAAAGGGARPGFALRRACGARRAGPDGPPRRGAGSGGGLGRRQVGAAADPDRTEASRGRRGPHLRPGRLSQLRKADAVDRAAVGRAVPDRGPVHQPDCARERHRPDARARTALAPDHARTGRAETRPGGPAARNRGPEALGAVGRDDQAGRPGAGPGAGSGAALPRRADLGAGSDQRRRLR